MAHYKCKTCGWSGKVKGRKRCLKCYRESVSAWRKNNPEKVKAQKARYDKKFRDGRPEEYKAKRRKYYLKKTAQRAYERRKQWLLRGDVTREQLKAIFKLYGGECVYCGVAVKPRYSPNDPRGFDHVKSRAQGGKHTSSNIVPCCRRCNEIKG